MKYNRLIVLLENKSGSIYQVALSQEQMDAVADLIGQMHEGTIKILRDKLPVTLEKQNKN